MQDKKWVAGWGAAISVTAQNHADYFRDQTFRYVIFPTVAGSGLRLHFSNEYTDEPVTITKVFVARRTQGEYVDVSTNTQVTFNGGASLTMPAFGEGVSDEIPFDFEAGEEFCVSMYFEGMTRLYTGHSNSGKYIAKYYGKGDWAEKECVPLAEYGENPPYVFLHTIDFLCSSDVHAIIAFGDSITAQPWPDCLAHRLYDEGVRNVTVIRKAIGGGRMLREYSQRFHMNWGVAGVRRFERDILQCGADRVFILHGINDILHPQPTGRFCGMDELPTAQEMIENGYKKYIEIARKHGIKIYISPILACAKIAPYVGNREAIRQEVNAWIRNEADIDGIVDFEAATWNPENHQEYFPDYDSGDHLHPSFAGAQRMADSIPMELIL